MTTAQLVEEFVRHRRATERFLEAMPDEHFVMQMLRMIGSRRSFSTYSPD